MATQDGMRADERRNRNQRQAESDNEQAPCATTHTHTHTQGCSRGQMHRAGWLAGFAGWGSWDCLEIHVSAQHYRKRYLTFKYLASQRAHCIDAPFQQNSGGIQRTPSTVTTPSHVRGTVRWPQNAMHRQSTTAPILWRTVGHLKPGAFVTCQRSRRTRGTSCHMYLCRTLQLGFGSGWRGSLVQIPTYLATLIRF